METVTYPSFQTDSLATPCCGVGESDSQHRSLSGCPVKIGIVHLVRSQPRLKVLLIEDGNSSRPKRRCNKNVHFRQPTSTCSTEKKISRSSHTRVSNSVAYELWLYNGILHFLYVHMKLNSQCIVNQLVLEHTITNHVNVVYVKKKVKVSISFPFPHVYNHFHVTCNALIRFFD